MHDGNFSPNIFQGSDLLRLRQIIAPHGLLPISRSTWYQWQKTRKAPAPIRLGPRVTVYRRSDIEAFIANPESWRADK